MSIESLFREWLRAGHSGCYFAARAASKQSLTFFSTTGRLDLDTLANVIDDDAHAGRVTIATFPGIADIPQLEQLVARFDCPPRWSLHRVGPSGVAVEFITSESMRSKAMGFAPILEMPVSRRAPCVALALWGGGRVNPFFRLGATGSVNMAHAPHSLAKQAEHNELWAKTEAATQERLEVPAFDARWLHDVSFCLPTSTVDRLFPSA